MPNLLAPAKLNLTLEVLARRPDGYHGVRSVMVPVGLFDALAVEPASDDVFRCNLADLEQDNLVVRALRAAQCLPAHVTLEKRIPHGAGLGGGSSDAAAIVLAAMRGTIPRRAAAHDWLAVARGLGSDVPFFLAGTAALVEDTGERVTALGALPPWWCVVALPPCSVATALAYRLLDEQRAAAPAPQRPRATSASLRAVDALQRNDLDGMRAALVNDFEAVILRAFPAVRAAHEALSAACDGRATLSGSGAAVFALCASEGDARAVAERVDPGIARTLVTPFSVTPDWRGTA